jgi:hypothetical protein
MADAAGRARAPAALRSQESLARALEERRPRPPIELRHSAERAPAVGASPTARTTTQSNDEPSHALCCVGCGHRITHAGSMIEVAGRHAHACVNPAGITYRIACFREAPGVAGVGSWSSFFTWFADHLWQVVCCSSCSMHLGWGFEPERDPSPARRFYGLIRNRLREQGSAAPGA